MKIIELFAGDRSIGKIAEKYGHKVFSVDIVAYDGIDLVKDIEFLTIKDLPFIPDVAWGSPMCDTYSIAAISTHRDMGKPKTAFAAKSDSVIINVLKLYIAAGADPEGQRGEAHDPETHLIPNILLFLLDKRDSFNLYGTDFPTPDGSAVRDSIHVKDLARAHVLALKRLFEKQVRIYCYVYYDH